MRDSVLRKPVPLWLFLLGIISTASVTSAVLLIPEFLPTKADFAMTVSPSLQTIMVYNDHSAYVTVRSLNSFTGIVSLKVAYPPSSFNASVFSSTILSPDAIPLGHSQNLTLSFKAFAAGNYTIVLTATSGMISHSATLSVIARSVAISPPSSTIVVPHGTSKSVNITLTGQNGLSGNLLLSASTAHPAEINPGFNATVTPSSLMLPYDGTEIVTLTIEASNTAQNWYVGFSVCTTAGAPECVGETYYVVIS